MCCAAGARGSGSAAVLLRRGWGGAARGAAWAVPAGPRWRRCPVCRRHRDRAWNAPRHRDTAAAIGRCGPAAPPPASCRRVRPCPHARGRSGKPMGCRQRRRWRGAAAPLQRRGARTHRHAAGARVRGPRRRPRRVPRRAAPPRGCAEQPPSSRGCRGGRRHECRRRHRSCRRGLARARARRVPRGAGAGARGRAHRAHAARL